MPWRLIFLLIILLALVFGITNTMLMGVLERVRELGVVIALGMNHARNILLAAEAQAHQNLAQTISGAALFLDCDLQLVLTYQSHRYQHFAQRLRGLYSHLANSPAAWEPGTGAGTALTEGFESCNGFPALFVSTAAIFWNTAQFQMFEL